MLLVSVLLTAVGIAGAQVPASGVPMERLVLFDPHAAKQWSQAESSAETSTTRTRSSAPTLHWHVTVDHTTGEPKYPIGWPRITQTIPDGPLRDWSAWDFLHFWVFTETSRERLPRDPVGLTLYAPDKSSGFLRRLSELKKRTWTEVTVPIAQISRPADVRLIQFHISESDYRHQDTLDLYFDELALLRYAKPTLLDFAAERAVMFDDTKHIPAHFRLSGVKPDEMLEVSCELRREGRIAARASVKATRGLQRALLDVSRTRLTPGEYELVATVAGGPPPTAAKVRLVESPWR